MYDFVNSPKKAMTFLHELMDNLAIIPEEDDKRFFVQKKLLLLLKELQ